MSKVCSGTAAQAESISNPASEEDEQNRLRCSSMFRPSCLRHQKGCTATGGRECRHASLSNHSELAAPLRRFIFYIDRILCQEPLSILTSLTLTDEPEAVAISGSIQRSQAAMSALTGSYFDSGGMSQTETRQSVIWDPAVAP
jgi:hypothetical protein